MKPELSMRQYRHVPLLALLFLMAFSRLSTAGKWRDKPEQIDCKDLDSIRDHLRNSTGSSEVLPTWNAQYCCDWTGVICSSGVTRLELSGQNLVGTIPTSLSRLTNLIYLNLSRNRFTGSIPSQLNSLQHLKSLDLSQNEISGTIPGDLVPDTCELEFCNLEQNKLNGSIPTIFNKCPKLTKVFLASNSLSGELSNDVISHRSLQFLSIAGNSLNESIHPFGPALISVDLSNNQFKGWDEKQQQMCTSENLNTLKLSGNKLGRNGVVDNNFMARLTSCKNLQELDVSNNGFNGSFTSGILSTKLSVLRLRGNSIMGSFFSDIWNLANLSILDIGNTTLTGTVPSSLTNLTNLKELYLDHNSFSDWLNESLVSLQNLKLLDISNNNFSGNIPQNLEQCTGLEYLRLQNNFFSGNIPDFFRNLSGLKLLDLSFNDLEGPLPTGGIFGNSSGFLVKGNPKLCQADLNSPLQGIKFCQGILQPENGKDNPTGKSRSGGLPKAALAVIIIIVILFILFLVFWLLFKGNCFMNKPFGGFVKDISFLKAPLSVTCSDLQTATRGFSSAYLVGSGGIGSVYRGFLEREKKELAVKVLKEDTFGDSKCFLEECRGIRAITHHNLVKMLTSCLNVDIEGNRFKALIYDFMPNGNLEMWLHEEVVSQAMSFKKWNLNLYQRLSMAIDVASLLSHLHCNYATPIVHCNLKPSNILIAEDMTAHVTDFGMNKIFQVDKIVRNSAGYIAPECLARSPISPTWDVYSFGMILLEMFTGKRPTDEDFWGTSSLRKYVLQGYPSNVEEIIDPLLLSEETSGKLTDRSRECIISILNTALMCSKEVPGDRMVIQVAREKLEKAKSSFLEAGGDGEMQNTIDREGSSMSMLV